MSEGKPQGIGQWVRSWLLIALGVLIAELTSDGIYFDNNLALVCGVLIISFLNVFLRPLLILLTLPFVLLSLGLGLVVINALLLWIAGSLGLGFHVEGFWSALWGAIVIGFTSFVANVLLGDPKMKVKIQRGGPPRSGGGKSGGGDVIDV